MAQGDFSQRETVSSKDELGILMQSFNSMRQQLAETRAVVQRNQTQLADAHAYVQGILDNLSAGVLAFDDRMRLRSYNNSANAILDAVVDQLAGLEPERWHERVPGLATLAAEIAAAPRLLATPPLPMVPTDKVPPVRVVIPVKVFTPVRVAVPALVLVSVPDPPRMAEISPVPLRA